MSGRPLTDFVSLREGYHPTELWTQLLPFPQTLQANSVLLFRGHGSLKRPGTCGGGTLWSAELLRKTQTSPTVIQRTAGYSCIQVHCSSPAWNTGSDTIPFVGLSPASQAKGRRVLRLAWPYPSLTKQSPSLWWEDSSIPTRGTCMLFSEDFPNWG